ncbi:MAG: N-acetylmuramoyl-L-alanine amidase [Lachnospiraceae bacterium]|nr:N-acetylmuramoyl-L-alanine amidase [Robinsoniella sp.]MDY3767204.1 N-acetylmuramoyl-L-alanine amidase [Lachnospiraceae bacterium]
MRKRRKAITLISILCTVLGLSASVYAQETAQKMTGDQEKKSYIVAIDPGHQGPGQDMTGVEPNAPGSDIMKARIVSGTQGTTTGLAEYELNLSVALKLQKELETRGYRVVMMREDNDINISNVERAAVATEENADITIRIHANGSEDASACGALMLISSASNPYVGHLYEDSYDLAQCVLEAYCEATNLQNDGIMETDTMTGINWSTMPVTIIEMGFMTNPGDDLYMAADENQEIMAFGIADGIDTYFSQKGSTME